MLVKLKGHPFNMSIIQVYDPTSEHTDEEIEAFYEDIDKAKSSVNHKRSCWSWVT